MILSVLVSQGIEIQKLIDVVYRYCNRWRLKANVGKSAVMVFLRRE